MLNQDFGNCYSVLKIAENVEYIMVSGHANACHLLCGMLQLLLLRLFVRFFYPIYENSDSYTDNTYTTGNSFCDHMKHICAFLSVIKMQILF